MYTQIQKNTTKISVFNTKKGKVTSERGNLVYVPYFNLNLHLIENFLLQEKLNRNFPNIAKQMAALVGEEEEEEDEKGETYGEEQKQDEEEQDAEKFRDLGHVPTTSVADDVTRVYEPHHSSGSSSSSDPHHHHLLDHSSEAEAFNNVASGIAASLGLEQQQQQQAQHQQHILLPDQSGTGQGRR
jgi:hypothetical protein